MTSSENYLSVTPDNLNFNSNSGSSEVSVSSNMSWDVSEDLDWVSVDPKSGQNNQIILVSVDENTSDQPRNGTIYFTNSDITKSIIIAQEAYQPPAPTEFELSTEVFLEGPYINNNEMATVIGDNSTLPFFQPFNTPPWDYNGIEELSSIPLNIVDWVLISLRGDIDKNSTVVRKAALLKNNGSVVDINGIDPPTLNVVEGSYYLVVEHRNHLPIMSKEKINFYATQFDCDPPLNDLVITGRGCFEDNIGSWKPFNGNLVEISTEYAALGTHSLKITVSAAGSGAYMYLNNENDLKTNLTIGQSYKLVFTSYSTLINSSAKLSVRGDSGSLATQSLNNSPQYYELNFIADNTTWNDIAIIDLNEGEEIFIDNISLIEN